MSLLFLDLETVPANEVITEDDLRAALPKNITKQETIVKRLKEDRENLIKTIIKKRSLDPYECKIVCLSYSFDGEEPQALTGLESIIMTNFESRITDYIQDTNELINAIYIVGHNLKSFDAPILFLRAAKYNNDTVKQLLPRDKYRKRLVDTMDLGTYFSHGKMVSMDLLCRYLDIPTPKGEMDGSKVYDAYKKGQIEEIARYCNQDVEALILIHDKLSL